MNKVLVTGPPRSGTTFLMEMFWECGIEIGFFRRDVSSKIESTGPGLEYLRDKWARKAHYHALRGYNAFDKIEAEPKDISPPIIKHPVYELDSLDYLFERFEKYDWNLDLVVITQRKSEDVIDSLKRLGKTNRVGLTIEQLDSVLERLGEKVSETPKTYIEFPRMIKDKDYCWESLLPVWEQFGVDKSVYKEAYKRVVKC